MSFIQLRVELPAYSHSFVIQVPQTCTIAQVKQEIYKSCIGGPQVDGQRIIYRGRYLVDHEKVDELWKSPDEQRIVHLAVHPSAWSSPPPEVPPPPRQAPSQLPASSLPGRSTAVPSTHLRSSQVTGPAVAAQTPHPLTYVLKKHQQALSVLIHGSLVSVGSDMALRSMSVRVVESHGWSWPTILDEEFPAPTPGGLQYDRVTLDGQVFLSLRRPSATPTPFQTHALKILTYTFTLLSIPISNTNTTPSITSQFVPIPPNVNQFLQQLDLPELLGPNAIQNLAPNQVIPGLQEMPLRPFLAPLVLLVFRTLLLLYFVAPARKPIFGILILAWMLYEIWRPIRNGVIRGLQRAAPDNERRQNMPIPQPAPDPPADVPGPPQNIPDGAAVQNNNGQQATAILDMVANQNILEEEQILNGADLLRPGLRHKVWTLVGLLVTTMHPAVWNRRRVVLSRREGRIRTEANMRDASPADADGEDVDRGRIRTELQAQHSRRPRWVREYIDRVVVADWVDDSD